jgi:general secretion pathway protein I
MSPTRQQGFTLIEVVVAFSIFALSMGALYESFAGAVRRNLQAHEREQALLAAQSVLANVRITPPPWKPEETGTLEGGWLWRVEVAPFDAAANERSPWRAFAVTVHLAREGSDAKEVVLRSLELARTTP